MEEMGSWEDGKLGSWDEGRGEMVRWEEETGRL